MKLEKNKMSAFSDFYRTAKQILTAPEIFFNSVTDDLGYKKPWVYYARLTAFYMAIYMFASVPVFISIYSSDAQLAAMAVEFGALSIFFTILIIVASFVLIYAIVLGAVFALTGLTHIFMLITGAKKRYAETFKIVCYASTPIIFIAPFAFLDFFGDIGAAIFLTISLVFSIYLMVLEVKGAMILHDLSRRRAFLGMVVLPTLLMMVIIIVLVLFIFNLGLGSVAIEPTGII
jgi:hypothetical protein